MFTSSKTKKVSWLASFANQQNIVPGIRHPVAVKSSQVQPNSLTNHLCSCAPQARSNHERAVVSREEQFIRYKAYGDESKQPLVIVPGLDGVTAFFADVLPELTLNVRQRWSPANRTHRGNEWMDAFTSLNLWP